MTAILQVEDLHVAYGETRVLHGIGFAVEARGITTILGANGAGKTTTLRAVSGIVPPRGRIELDGRRIDGKACEDITRLGIAHVPEGRGTFVGFTVEENLRLGAHVRRDRTGVSEDMERVYGYFPVLGQRRSQVAGTLSGGEQQMLALAAPSCSGLACCSSTSRRSASRPWWSRRSSGSCAPSTSGKASACSWSSRTRRSRSASPTMRTSSRPGASSSRARRRRSGRTTPSGGPTLGIETLLQQIVSGLATGGIYASLALALVMIYQATEIVNFAQGEMAMFSTYLAWSMLNAGAPYWVAFFATVVLAFAGGFLIERIVIRPIEGKPVLTLVIVCIGLLVILNSLAGWICTRTSSSRSRARSPGRRSASARWCSASTIWASSA